jgi:probable F420-dependent oxidoreductase
MRMQIGVNLPFGDIGTGPTVMRDYAQAAEGLGFDFLVCPDHVLSADPAKAPAGSRAGNYASAYQDPFVLFAYLSGLTKKIGFASGVLILAQRQAALVAKQAACLDELSGGRFRLGVGVGWNTIEFEGLGMDFHTRGKRSEEQVQFMQALWANPSINFKGKYHQLTDGGINPRPKSGKVPVWFGGHAEQTLERVAKYGDGFIPNRWPPGDEATAVLDKLRGLIKAAGRDPKDVGLDVWTSVGKGTEDDWRKEIAFWKKAGATHITAHTTFSSAIHQRIAGKTYDDHLKAITRYREAVKDLL